MNEDAAREGVSPLAAILGVTGVLATTAAIFFGTLYAVKPGAGLAKNPTDADDRRELARLNQKADLLHKNYRAKFGDRYDLWPEYALRKVDALESKIVELTYLIDAQQSA